MSFESRRKSERKSTTIPVEVNLGHCTMPYTMSDISEGGAGFRGNGTRLLDSGQPVDLTIEDIGTLSGTIQWTGNAGFGIRFDEQTLQNAKLDKILG